MDNAELHVNAEAPPLSGNALETLAIQYNAAMTIVRRLSRRYDKRILKRLIHMPVVDDVLIDDKTKLKAWLKELEGRLNVDQNLSRRYQVELDAGQERILLSHWVHGISTEQHLSFEFFASSDYRKLTELGNQLDGLLSEGAYVQRGEKVREVTSFGQALEWLTDEAKRGQHIQRYKGLGEMNPSQLWDTTMNPESRRLLRVSIEDAVGADEIFTTLMGDQVEPRREFIEKNALTVSNLDV